MKIQTNIIQYIENMVKSLKRVEKSSEVFSELQEISQELENLQKYMITTFNTLENNFNSFVRQVDMLSDIIEFQRSVMNFKNSQNLIHNLFDFFERRVPSDHAFIAFRLKDEDKTETVITNRPNNLDNYRQFLAHEGIDVLKSIVQERDLAYLIGDVENMPGVNVPWDLLDARSVILFPLKVQGKFLGTGYLIRTREMFSLNDLSFINLILGLISLVIYQHYYFAQLKSRLFKQFRLRKVLEEVKYAEYFEKGPLYIFTLDPRYIVLHANATAFSKLQIHQDMIVGENFLEIIPKTHRNEFKRILDTAQEGQVQYFRSPVEGKKRPQPIMEFYVSRVIIQNNFILILVFAVDITQMYYRDVLEQRNMVLDELDQLARTLVSEFNNLLTMVVPNISLMRTQLPQEHQFQKYLEIMEKATQRSSNFVQKFLNYDLEEFETYETGNLNKIVKHFISQFKKELPKNIQVRFDLDVSLKNITYYPRRIKRLLRILFENSVNALIDRENPVIQVSTRHYLHEANGLVPEHEFYLKKGEYVELCVYDNGCGIPQQMIPQVFKPFYSTRIKNEGVGLGLFIAYNIVKDLQGEIFIESKNQEYTAVYVYLPIKVEEESVTRVAVEGTETVQPSVEHVPTLLVVDDEYNIRSMMREIMEMYGFRVYTAGNGEEGLEIYKKRKNDIDLVILDMIMPIMDGRTAFSHIRKINPNQKVFIISGYSQREDLEDILEKGAIGYLRKPFQVNEIVNKIKEILNV